MTKNANTLDKPKHASAPGNILLDFNPKPLRFTQFVRVDFGELDV